MPLYEYACDSCNNVFERRHGFNETVNECPACGRPVRRVLQAAGVVFKGSGWYITDSRKSSDSESSSSTNKKDTKTEVKSDSGTASETKVETKAEPKSEPKSEPSAAAPAV